MGKMYWPGMVKTSWLSCMFHSYDVQQCKTYTLVSTVFVLCLLLEVKTGKCLRDNFMTQITFCAQMAKYTNNNSKLSLNGSLRNSLIYHINYVIKT